MSGNKTGMSALTITVSDLEIFIWSRIARCEQTFIKSYKVTNYIVTFNRVLCQMQTRSSFDDHPSPHTHQSGLYVSCLFWTVLVPSAELGREYDPLCLQQRREVLHSERNSVEVRICCMQKSALPLLSLGVLLKFTKLVQCQYFISFRSGYHFNQPDLSHVVLPPQSKITCRQP